MNRTITKAAETPTQGFEQRSASFGAFLADSPLRSNLYENSLTGALPPEVGSSTALAVLSLDSNSLTGTVPSEVGFLTALSCLIFHENGSSCVR